MVVEVGTFFHLSSMNYDLIFGPCIQFTVVVFVGSNKQKLLSIPLGISNFSNCLFPFSAINIRLEGGKRNLKIENGKLFHFFISHRFFLFKDLCFCLHQYVNRFTQRFGEAQVVGFLCYVSNLGKIGFALFCFLQFGQLLFRIIGRKLDTNTSFTWACCRKMVFTLSRDGTFQEIRG